MKNNNLTSTHSSSKKIVLLESFVAPGKRIALQMYQTFLMKRSRKPLKNTFIDLPDSGSYENPGKEDSVFVTSDVLQTVPVTTKNIRIKPEAAFFFIETEGITKNLLLYLIVTQPSSDIEFVWTAKQVREFKEWYQILGKEAPSNSAIEKGIKTLSQINAIKNLKQGRYMINPYIMTPEKTDQNSNFLNFVTRGIEKVCWNVGSTKNFVSRHLFPKTKPVRKQTKVASLHPPQNQVAS